MLLWGLYGCGEQVSSANESEQLPPAVEEAAPPAAGNHPVLPPAEPGAPLASARQLSHQELSQLQRLSWETLEDVSFRDEYFEQVDGYMMMPEYGLSVKALENKEVFISGYLIPVDVNWYILSAFPYSSCFFCGGAGPESVVELEFDEKTRRFKTDEWLSFKGTFVLNPDDIDHLPYMLKHAELIELEE
ncbi:MAG: DUF3299 domain-containing protein [Bacteroidetes bacterium]|nr:MAG: DUF3299 domain-containing protein [Bacteroidota bacterium]